MHTQSFCLITTALEVIPEAISNEPIFVRGLRYGKERCHAESTDPVVQTFCMDCRVLARLDALRL